MERILEHSGGMVFNPIRKYGSENPGGRSEMKMRRGLMAPSLALALLGIGCSGHKENDAVRSGPAEVLTQAGADNGYPAESRRKVSDATLASGVAVEGGAAADALGKFRILIPEAAHAPLKGARIENTSEGTPARELTQGELKNLHLLPAGRYRLALLFSNPNYQPPTVGPAVDFEVKQGEATNVTFGAVAFTVKDELVDLNIDGIRIVELAGRIPPLELRTHGNDYYLFKPKAIPAGDYAVELLYFRSPKPAAVIASVSVTAGEEATVALDAGICLDKPAIAGVLGWDLLPAGGGTPILEVRRGTDNDEPLWRKFIVPPGRYDLRLHVRDLPGPVVAGRDLEVAHGALLKVNPSP